MGPSHDDEGRRGPLASLLEVRWVARCGPAWTTVQAKLDTGRGKDDLSEEALADLHGGSWVPELSWRGGGPRAREQQVKRRGQA